MICFNFKNSINIRLCCLIKYVFFDIKMCDKYLIITLLYRPFIIIIIEIYHNIQNDHILPIYSHTKNTQ